MYNFTELSSEKQGGSIAIRQRETDHAFLFIIFADIFFIIISLFQGGLFRGWLAKNNRPNNEKQTWSEHRYKAVAGTEAVIVVIFEIVG